jgi:hypothetical protein
MHHAQGQRGVGARQQGNVLVALVGGLGAPRVDADQLGAVALGLLRMRQKCRLLAIELLPQIRISFDSAKELHLHADLAAERLRQPSAAGAGADGAVQQRRAQPVEEARGRCFRPAPAPWCRHSCRAGWPGGAGAAPGDGRQPGGDVGSAAPSSPARTGPAALGAAALERLQDALGMVGALGVARDLGAQGPAGVRMRRDCPAPWSPRRPRRW